MSQPNRIAAILTLLALAALSVSTPARAYDKVVVFGDSLSDNGNVAALVPSNLGVYPAAPYAAGRLSNGKVWAEDFAASLGVPLDDRAFAGALTDTTNGSNAVLTAFGLPANALGIQTQVSNYVAANPKLDANALYIVWGGANDLLTNATAYYTNYLGGGQLYKAGANNIAGEVTALKNAGATNFLIPNLANLGETPIGTGASSTALDTLTVAHNLALKQALGAISGVSIKTLDVNSLFADAQTSPAKYGLTDATHNFVQSNGKPQGVTPTLSSYGAAPGANPSKFLFWDEIHPTAAGHSILSTAALSAVGAVAVPETGAAGLLALGLSVIGAGGLVAARRRVDARPRAVLHLTRTHSSKA